MRNCRATGVLAALSTMVPGVAVALAPGHVLVGGGGIDSGLLHPFLVPEHAMALVGLGLVIGQQEEGRVSLSALFVAGLIAGLGAIALAAGPSHANDVLVVGAALTGALAALARPVPPLLGWPLAAAIGTSVGLDSPPDVIDLWTATGMLIGTACGAIVIVVLVAGIVVWLHRDWQKIGVRIAGSWTAAAAILVLAVRVAA